MGENSRFLQSCESFFWKHQLTVDQELESKYPQVMMILTILNVDFLVKAKRNISHFSVFTNYTAGGYACLRLDLSWTRSVLCMHTVQPEIISNKAQ